jgi:hypothetical protein
LIAAVGHHRAYRVVEHGTNIRGLRLDNIHDIHGSPGIISSVSFYYRFVIVTFSLQTPQLLVSFAALRNVARHRDLWKHYQPS